MRQLLHFAGFLLLGIGPFETTTFASVTDPNCGGLNERACTLFDAEFWSNNSAFCDFGLKSNKGVLTALSGGAAGTCINDNRQTVPKDNSWTGWALSEQRYNIQKDLPINFITHLGTHNSFSNYADKDNNWLSTNQQLSITDQLNFGARVIRLDPHYYFGEMRLCHSESNANENSSAKKVLESCTSQAIGQYIPIAVLLAPHLTEIHLLPSPIPTIIDGFLASILVQAGIKGTIAINNRLYANGIREVADWLNDNPGEFIVLMGDDYSQGHDDLINTPIQNFLGSKVWAKADQDAYEAAGGQGWPTMTELQARHKQVIIFSKPQDGVPDETHGGTWLFSEKTYVTSIFPKIASGTKTTDADLSANPDFLNCSTSPFLAYQRSNLLSDRKRWFQTGEGRTGSDYLFGGFTGEVNAPQVQQAALCGFSTIRLDFFMALDKAYSKYRHSEADSRREAAIWSYAEGDFGLAGPAVMTGTTGRWTSVNIGNVMKLACATTDRTKARQWAVSPTASDYYSGADKSNPNLSPASDPCRQIGVNGSYAFAAPRTASENQALFAAVKAANVTQVMLKVAAVPIPPAYTSPSYLKQYMDRGSEAPDQVVEKVNGFHDLWFAPELTTNESNALSITQPLGRTPLDGGFIPMVLEYDQTLAQALGTGGYSAMTALNLYTKAFGLYLPYPFPPDPNYHRTSSAISLQVLEPTHTQMLSTPPEVEPGTKATFTVQVSQQCGTPPVNRDSGGTIPITGGVSFTEVFEPSYGGQPLTRLLGTIPINNSPSDAKDNDNGVMHAIINQCADNTVCAYTNDLEPGRHSITAVYHQDGLYGSSSSGTHVIDVLDPSMPGGRVDLTLGSTPSQTYSFRGNPGETWQVYPGARVTVTPSSGKITGNQVSITVAILDAPDLLPGVIDTNINVLRYGTNGTLSTDAYQPVRITVPTRLSVQQTPLSFSATDNTPSPQQEIAVTYDGGPLTITPDVSTPQQWLAGGLDDTGTQSRGSQVVKVWAEVNPAGLAPGHYSGALRIGAPSGPGIFSVPVTLDVYLAGPNYTVSTNPPGLRVTVDGVEQATPVTFQWTQGSTHSLTTPAGYQGAGEGVRAIWTSWSDGGAIAHNVIANGSIEYKANFQMQYQLTSQRSPVCGGTVTPAGNWFDAGATAHVGAGALTGYAFSSFSGDANSTSNTVAILMDRPRAVTANFNCLNLPNVPCLTALPVTYATGDLNHDGHVDCTDVAIVKAALGKKTGQAGFDARADVNGDGVVDVRDLALVTQQLPTGTVCK